MEFEDATVAEQRYYEEYQKTKSENYHLKRQLENKNKDIKRLKHIIRVWKNKAENSKKRDHYKNGKRGTKYNG
jgi:hypothetical protein